MKKTSRAIKNYIFVINTLDMKLGLMTKNECIDFIEFNITGDNDNYNKCAPESMYLNSSVFNIFASCFEQSNYLFEVVGETKYNIRKLIPLRNELKENLGILSSISTLQAFKSYVTSIFLGRDLLIDLGKVDADWEKRYKYYLRRLIVINRDLIKLVDFCTGEERILWVIGY